jgi:SAM-dependent methyltransferase
MIAHCPICGGAAFADFNTRPKARCTGCGSLERGRYQWLVLHRLIRLEAGAVVAHFAPEAFFMDHFAGRPELTYRAFDVSPQHYRHDTVDVAALDLCADLPGLASASFDLIMHSHVLEHLPCAVQPVLLEMKRLLKPGGAIFFSVPIEGDVSVEGIDPARNAEEAGLRARQGEHMRVFGRRDFPEMLRRVLGADGLVRQREHFSDAELTEAGVPLARSGEPTSKSVFIYRKPGSGQPAS